MTQPNGHTSARAIAAKAKTTEALKGDILTKQSDQNLVLSTSRTTAMVKEQLYATQNAITQLETIIQAHQVTLADEKLNKMALEAYLAMVEQAPIPEPTFTPREQQQIGS